MTELTPAQDDLMAVIYGRYGLWDPPCQHLHPAWVIDADGTGRCTMCPAKWTMADERDRAHHIAIAPPLGTALPGESDRDRMWREFRESTWRNRTMIMPLPPQEEESRAMADPVIEAIAQEMDDLCSHMPARLIEDETLAKVAAWRDRLIALALTPPRDHHGTRRP